MVFMQAHAHHPLPGLPQISISCQKGTGNPAAEGSGYFFITKFQNFKVIHYKGKMLVTGVDLPL